MKESCMAWFVLSSSFLPDGTTAGSILPPYLDTVVKNSGYNVVNLTNIMRNSSSISSAAASDFEKYNVTQYKFTLSLSGGHCSTVIGIKPTCFLYRSDKDKLHDDRWLCQTFLGKKKELSDCGALWSKYFTSDIFLFDAGMEEFNEYRHRPRHYSADLPGQREGLLKWLDKGGVLITHSYMFRGCEAETVVYISQSYSWGQYASEGLRLGFTSCRLNFPDKGKGNDYQGKVSYWANWKQRVTSWRERTASVLSVTVSPSSSRMYRVRAPRDWTVQAVIYVRWRDSSIFSPLR